MSLVGRDGASGPELVEMATGAAPLFWTGAASHVLRVARRLADDGYLTAHSEAATTRPRTVYEMTDKGHQAIRSWPKKQQHLFIQQMLVLHMTGALIMVHGRLCGICILKQPFLYCS